MIKITASKDSKVKYSCTSMVFLNSNSVRINIFSYIPVRLVEMVSFFTNFDYAEEIYIVLYDHLLCPKCNG